MPLRPCYVKERKEGECKVLLGKQPTKLETLHYKKTEEHGIRRPQDPTIQRDIQTSDSLVSLSIKYKVPIAELKRVNNILTDQGFFALNKIKIPVKPYSLILQPDEIHGSGNVRNNNGWLVESNKPSSTFSSEDLDRIKEKHSVMISVAEDQILIKKPLKFPIMAAKIPDHPGCSNRVLLVLYCCCGIVGFLIFVAFMVHISHMGLADPQDNHHDNLRTQASTLPKPKL